MKKLLTALLSVVFILATGCDADNTQKNTKKSYIIIAKATENISHLYYSGTIEPLATRNIINQVDGMVTKIYVQYGEWVKANQKLATIRSSKEQQNYAKVLTDYVKSKDQYLRDKTNFEATATLYQNGIVSKEEYLTQKSQYETAELSYLAAIAALKSKASLVTDQPLAIEKLTLENMEELRKAFEKEYVEMDIYSPITGILLAPHTSNKPTDGGNSNTAIAEGSNVKENQTLFTIGDMSGIATHVEVSETQINAIQKNQAVVITSWALPGIILQGKVTHVARQAAINTSTQGMAKFVVEIIVPEITTMQRALIRVGMTAKIDIAIPHSAEIQLPLQAVIIKDGSNYVIVIDPKTKAQKMVPVEIGETDVAQITITKGIKSGDAVLVSS